MAISHAYFEQAVWSQYVYGMSNLDFSTLCILIFINRGQLSAFVKPLEMQPMVNKWAMLPSHSALPV